MPSFRPNGTTGQAPTTIYFGAVPDQYNVLSQGYMTTGGNFVPTGWTAANLLSGWTPYNPSQAGGANTPTTTLGANTSAPDGTNNGQLLQETSTNTIHAARTIFQTNAPPGNFNLRVSIFAKAGGAGGRTRFALYIGDGLWDPAIFVNNGCKVVFDLAGGQIGVPYAAYGGGVPYKFVDNEIVPFGNGWYRCTVTTLMGSTGTNCAAFGILLDNGSGTAAESTSYAGNGTSGVYIWRTTSLPPGAWSLNNTTFFDDFTSLSTIDTGNTGGDGFKWWVNSASWPGYINNQLNPNTSAFSINAGTQLKVNMAAAVLGNTPQICMTAFPTGGQTFKSSLDLQPPFLIECKMGWDNVSVASNGIYWTHSYVTLLGNTSNTGPVGSLAIEDDFMEGSPSGGAINNPGTTLASVPAGGSGVTDTMASAVGYKQWFSSFTYSTGNDVVIYVPNSTLYQNIGGTQSGNIPPSSPADWSVFTPSIVIPNPPPIDFSQMNKFAILSLPYSLTECGQVLCFFNNAYCFKQGNGVATYGNGHAIHAPVLNNIPGSQFLPTSQGPGSYYTSKFTAGPLMLWCNTPNNGGNVYFDSVKVTR